MIDPKDKLHLVKYVKIDKEIVKLWECGICKFDLWNIKSDNRYKQIYWAHFTLHFFRCQRLSTPVHIDATSTYTYR